MTTHHTITTYLTHKYPKQKFNFTTNNQELTITWEDGLATQLIQETLTRKYPNTPIHLNRTMSKAFETAVLGWCNNQIGRGGYKMVKMGDPTLYPHPLEEHPLDLYCNYELLPYDMPAKIFPYLTISYGGEDLGGFRNYRITVKGGELYINGQPAIEGRTYKVPPHAKGRTFLPLDPWNPTPIRVEDNTVASIEWERGEEGVTGLRFVPNRKVLEENPNLEGETKFIVAVGRKYRYKHS